MRGAGCTFNDIVDRDFDARVERTRGRPIPSGAGVSVRQAASVPGAAAGGGRVDPGSRSTGLAIALGFALLLLVATYPFMKRITYWPQAFLGLTFNWGALMGCAAAQRRRSAWPRCPALCRRHRLDPRLRHDLRPSGQGGRRADRRQILGARRSGRTDTAVPLRRSIPRRSSLWAAAGVAAGLGFWPSGSRSSSARFQLAWQAGAVDTRRQRPIASPSSSRTAWSGWLLLAASSPRMSSERRRVLHPRQHRRRGAAASVPEIRLHLATEVTPLWQATEATLRKSAIAAALLGLRLAGRPGAGALCPRSSRNGGRARPCSISAPAAGWSRSPPRWRARA